MGTAGVQGVLWGAAAEDWAALAEPLQVPFFEAALDAVGIEQGTRLLDAGCGSGLALTLAMNLGAVVTGLDASEGLLAIARKRLPSVDLREGDLEALPFPDASFDAVTAFNSVQSPVIRLPRYARSSGWPCRAPPSPLRRGARSSNAK